MSHKYQKLFRIQLFGKIFMAGGWQKNINFFQIKTEKFKSLNNSYRLTVKNRF